MTVADFSILCKHPYKTFLEEVPDNLDDFLCICDWTELVTTYKQIWLLLLLGSANVLHICGVGTLK